MSKARRIISVHPQEVIAPSFRLNLESTSSASVNGAQLLTAADQLHGWATLKYLAGTSSNPISAVDNLTFNPAISSIAAVDGLSLPAGNKTIRLTKKGVYNIRLSLHTGQAGVTYISMKVDGAAIDADKRETNQVIVGVENVTVWEFVFNKTTEGNSDITFALSGQTLANAALPQTYDAAGEVRVIRHVLF